MNDQLQERLGVPNAGSLISQFQALDRTLWPPVGDSRAEVTALYEHYAALLERQGATKEETFHEYRLYKSWATSRATSARETFLALLQRYLQCCFYNVCWSLCLHRHSLHVCQCSIVTSASRGPTEQAPLPGRAGGRLPDDGRQHGGLRASAA